MTATTKGNTMADTKYNGWTNYETWLVKLWMDNDQGSYEYWKEEAQNAYASAVAGEVLGRDMVAVSALRDTLQASFEEQWQDVMGAAGKHVHMASAVWADLMNAALSEVDWLEIAESLIGEVDKAAAE